MFSHISSLEEGEIVHKVGHSGGDRETMTHGGSSIEYS